MTTNDRIFTDVPPAGHHHHREAPLELDISPETKGLTVDDHQHFIRSISTDSRGVDEIDRSLDDEIEIDPYVTGTNNRRSDRELNRMLDLIDNLPISDNGKEGSR